MRYRLTQRIAHTAGRLRQTPLPAMKELEVYGALALGGLIFLVIVFRLLSG